MPGDSFWNVPSLPYPYESPLAVPSREAEKMQISKECFAFDGFVWSALHSTAAAALSVGGGFVPCSGEK